MKERIYIATYSENAVDVIREYGLGIELNDFCISENLDEDKIQETFGYIEEELVKSKAERLILHAPFTEIIPSSIDHRAVELGMERLEEAYAAAKKLKIKRMVVHSGYMPLLYFKEWHLEKSVEFWRQFMKDKPEDFYIYIENVFEDEPYMLKDLIDEIGDLRVKICLDVGHANVCTNKDLTVIDWIRILGKDIGHFHLHNNNGEKDLHGPINQGIMDMGKILQAISKYCSEDVTLTIESRICAESAAWLLTSRQVCGKIKEQKPKEIQSEFR